MDTTLHGLFPPGKHCAPPTVHGPGHRGLLSLTHPQAQAPGLQVPSLSSNCGRTLALEKVTQLVETEPVRSRRLWWQAWALAQEGRTTRTLKWKHSAPDGPRGPPHCHGRPRAGEGLSCPVTRVQHQW